MSSQKRLFLVIWIVVFVAFFCGIGGAEGRPLAQATATATRDIRTPPATITPGGEPGGFFPTSVAVDYSCPDFIPVGWGTLTPSSLWGVVCGGCYPTETPIPTYDFNEVIPTKTARFCEQYPLVEGCNTATPSPPATATATPTGIFTCGGTATATVFAPSATATISYSNVTVETSSGSVTKNGTWNSGTLSCAGDNNRHTSTDTDDYVEFTYTGASVTLHYAKSNSRGIAEIIIDSAHVEDLDMYSASGPLECASKTYNLGHGTHTIRVRVTGTKNASSSDDPISLDKFVYQGNGTTPTPPSGTGFDCGTMGSGQTCQEIASNHLRFTYVGISEDIEWPFTYSPDGINEQWSVHIDYADFELDCDPGGPGGPDACDDRNYDLEVTNASFGDQLYVVDIFNPVNAETFAAVTQRYFTYKSGSGESVSIIGNPTLDDIQKTITIDLFSYIQCPLLNPATGTPYPDIGYCYTVDDGTADVDDISIIDDTGISYCFIIPSLSADGIADAEGIVGILFDTVLAALTVMFGPTIVTPAITVCTVLYDFVSFDFFGVWLNWAWFIDLFMVGYVLNHLWRR